MKKIILTTLFIIVSLFASISVSANENIDIYIDGNYLASSAPVLTVADRTMVPMRDICEALGYNVEWNGDDQSILVSGGRSDNMRLSMRINTYSMNRLVKTNSPQQITLNMDVPPMLINDRTYLPVRALSEALFFNVDWDGVNNIVYISQIGGPNAKIGSTSAGQWSKIMIEDEYDTQAGLMDLYGNWIIPMQEKPSDMEVFYRTGLEALVNRIGYGAMEVRRDGGWSSWDYQVNLYESESAMINHALPHFSARFALDGTVHSLMYDKKVKNGIESYGLRSDYNPNVHNPADYLYLSDYTDNNGNRLFFTEDGKPEKAYDRNWNRIDISDVKR